jgi:hypothetical protein
MTMFTTYDAVGIKEDVSDVISRISPTKTPFTSLIKGENAKQRRFDWQEDELAAPRDNAQVEGFDAVDATLSPTVMRSNYTQIFEKTIKISTTEDAVDQYGRAKETALQLSKAAAELKRDVELAYVGRDQAYVAGTSAIARRTASVTQQIDAGLVVAGAAGALTEAMLLEAGQLAYTEGGEPDVFMIKPTDALIVAGFAGAAGRTREIGNETKLVNVVDLYVSPFGEYKVVLNRFILPTIALLFDPSMWKSKTLRPWTREALAKTGDNSKHLMVGEMGLKHENFKADALISGIL